MKFEWDDDKYLSNLEKHQFDFEDVKQIFDNPRVTKKDIRKDYGEDRWISLGELEGVVFSVVYTMRDPDIIRVISARKASRKERRIYYGEVKD